MSLRIRNFCGLDHELGDVGEESALTEIDFLERDGREELREYSIDFGRSFGIAAGSGQSGGEAISLGGLVGLGRVVLAERRVRRGEVHAAAAVQSVEMGASGIGSDVESGFRPREPRKK